MSKDIFISYSRRDQEFVTRLAADLNAQVAGVWFDQSTIQAGQNWHDEIMEGIQECKAFVLVLSPDAADSKYVQEEVDRALELGKPIFPVIYRPAEWKDTFAQIVKDIQTINLHLGSYTDNFHKLVDGLVEAGAIKTTYERPFLREPAKISLETVIRKALGWASAWSVGWLVFWSLTFIFLFLFIALQSRAGWEDVLNFVTVSLSGLTGGFIGGFVAGILSMLVLRPYAPSIVWKHMSPTIRIWMLSGPIGMIISGIITVIMLVIGVISTQSQLIDCEGLGASECFGRLFASASEETIGTVVLLLAVFSTFAIVTWFLTGLLAGWLVVRHVRRLEPGITRQQGWKVATSWGCGAIVAAAVTILTIGAIAKLFGL